MQRRALLSALGSSFLVGTAGCLSDSAGTNGPSPTGAVTSTPTSSATETGEPSATETTNRTDDRVGIGVLNETDAAYTVSIRLTDGDEAILDETLDVRDGIHRSVRESRVGEGSYRVVAAVDTGAALEYEWRVTDELRGLTLVLTADGELEPRQRSNGGVADESLPYAVDGAWDILSPPSVEIRNDSDEDIVVTVALEREGTRFFEHAFEATTDREIVTPPVVASAGIYDVFAEADDGRRATYEWEIPEDWHWPVLTVLVGEDGTLRVGCGFGGETTVSVKNRDRSARTTTLQLLRGDDVVAETTETVPPGDGLLALSVPIDDEYELRAETAEGADEAGYSTRYCYGTQAEVRISEGTPSIETMRYVCE